MNKPLISVIVPVYNTAICLSECLDSIINQSYTNLEIIIINDGSTDNSEEIINKYKEKDSRIISVNQLNSGQSVARNNGIELATGEYISFIDSDDVIDKDFLTSLLDAIIQSDVLIAECNIDNFSELTDIKSDYDKLESKILRYSDFVNYPIIQGCFSESMCNKIFAADCIKKYRFEEGKIFEDSRLVYKIYFDAEKIAFINYPGYHYRKIYKSTTRSEFNEKKIELLDVVKTRIDFFKGLGWDNHVKFTMADYARRALMFYVACIKEKADKSLLNKIQVILKENKKEFLNNPFNPTKTALMLKTYYLSPRIFYLIYTILKK